MKAARYSTRSQNAKNIEMSTTTTATVPVRYVTFHGANGEGKRAILSGGDLKETFESIPQIDFTNMYSSLEERQELAREVRQAFTKSGFLYARNHGIPEDLQAELLTVIKAFFELPAEEKMRIHINKSPEIKGYECLLETKLDKTTRGGTLTSGSCHRRNC